MKTLLERFEEKIYYSIDGCWYWVADINEFGYGRILINKVAKLAHRVSFSLFKGEIGNLYVCHTCDNPCCVNPNHLFLGDQTANMQDCKNKGRKNQPFGERHPNSILTEHQVKEIRSYKGKLSARKLSQKLGLGFRIVDNILYNKKAWKHIQ